MGTCPDSIKRLIDRFDQQADQVRSPDYNETQLRIDFVNPLFSALGWDMDNSQGYAEQYREVVHEDRVKVAGQTKAPDYSFRVGGTRKFFLEAKKPYINIKDDVEPAYQLRRYGWSAKLGVSLLTDFEEFAVYDCRIAPRHLDKARTARREYFTYHEYPARWEFLEGTFSKRAVLQGEFDRYCDTAKGRGGTEFDDTFLEEIEEWRLKLASNLALRNESLDQNSLNFSVQRIIDRIIFLRIAEDRGTESPMQLQALLSGDRCYARLIKLFRDADARYNSGLFHFEVEKNRDESPDTLTTTLDVDDAALKHIVKRLYYPESPYEFTVVTADILGSVYERFLGKVITLTTGHRAKIEEKPEVRKAGGVYYTPTYIVDYIVKNTVGKLLGEGGEIGFWVSGFGSGQTPNPNPETRSTQEQHGNQNLSATGGVGSIDAIGRGGLPTDQAIARRREVRSDQPTSPGGSVDPEQHRRGVRENPSRGLPTSPLVRQGERVGSRNAPGDHGTAETCAARQGAAKLGSVAASGKNADQTSNIAGNTVQTPDPKPQTRFLTRFLTPKDASKLKILDPACGSGSFLIGAYQYLLDWHLQQYLAMDPAKLATGKNPVLRPGPTGDYRLTIAERKRILLDNIHGVDLDSAAVEVTKLNLLLKCLEGETRETLGFTQRLFRERALPDLGHNIMCGNSLIGTDIMTTDAWKLMSDEEKARINPFDYERAFRQVFKQGGFDAVIGNPPYGYMIEEVEQAHYRSIYVHQDYQLDNYQLFLEKCAASLMRTPGRFGMIIPNPWLTNLRQRSLRAFVVQQCAIEEIVHFSFPVFSAAVVDTEVVILSKPLAARNTATALFVDDPSQLLDGTAKKVPHIQDVWLENPGDVINLSVDALSGSLAAKLRSKTNRTVDEIVALNVGIKPYQVGKGTPPQTRETVSNRPFDSERKIDKTYRPCLRGRDITRFSVVPTELRYLSYGPWLAEPRPAANFDAPQKILMRQTGDSLIAAIDDEQRVCMNNMHVLVPIDKQWPVNLVLGILNSKLLNWYYQTVNPERGEALAEIKRTHVAQLPLPDSSDASLSKEIASGVAIMVALHKRRTADPHPQRREQLQREIDATDRQIDQLVYQLYGLSDDEIQIVEEATK